MDLACTFKSQGIKVTHINIRSLRNSVHLTQVRELAQQKDFDIITISETWLNTSVSSSEVKIDGYKLFRLDRLHKRGGGVCAYVRKELKASVHNNLSFISEENFHQLWVTVQYKKLKFFLICVTYRPPDCPLSSFEDVFKPIYMEALTLNKPIVIMGDLNCDGLKVGCAEHKTLQRFLDEMNLSQLIHHPTRITDSSETLLDVVLVSSRSIVRHSGVLNVPISDHLPVYAELKLKSIKPSTQYITARSFTNYTPISFVADLAGKADIFLSIFDGEDVNTKLEKLNNAVESSTNVYAPIKTIKIRSRPCPFITQDIKDLMKRRNQLHQRFLKTRDITDWNNYKKLRNDVKAMLRKAELKYNSEEVQQKKGNSRSLWKIINRLIPSKEKDRHVYTKDLKSVANEFNIFFSTVGENAARESTRLAEINNISLNESLENLVRPKSGLFHFKRVTCDEVRSTVMSLPANKSPGQDKITSRIIKDSLPIILGPLTEIINCSLRTSTFPTAWKKAEVIPIHKEGDHEIASNNRPISLLAVASKVCEKIVLEQFSTYLINNNLLSHHQSGNKKHHSTETLNIFITDTILEAMDEKKLSALVLLDLSKAFDSINHQRLLHKLTNIGAAKETVDWFRSYLTDRVQSTRINSTLSDPLQVFHGVPQGGILSPLLFCIYINDLADTSHNCRLESYVDDTKTLLSFSMSEVDTAVSILERDLHSVATWCCKNQLLINPDKTKFIIIGTRQMLKQLNADISISFMGKVLKPEDSVEDLGITLDNHLSYDNHISKLVSSCMYKLFQINRVKDNFDKETLTTMITSLVINKLLYGSTVWSNTTSSNVKKLQAIQNFACKIITGTKKYDHVSPLLKQLEWLSIDKLLYFREAVMTYKCVNNLAPIYLCKKLIKRSKIHERFTRNCHSIEIPRFKTASGQRSFTYRAATIWNNLEANLKNNSFKNFKRQLKQQLLGKEI